MTIEEILTTEEGQTFDRKSIKIVAKTLSDPICAFANADGGTIAVGITNTKRDVEGVDYEIDKLNDILRVPLDYCNPTVEVTTEMVPCKDIQGRDNHVLLIHIEPSIQMHANQADEVFIRKGDKSKKLSFVDRTQLMYDKGMRYFEDAPVADAELDDIDMEFVEAYKKKIGYNKSALEYLKENKGFIKDKNDELIISTAAIILFGKNPQTYFPRARVRFIRYEGTEEKFGTQMNVIKDVIFEGNILQQVVEAVKYLNTQIKEKTYLGSDGLFKTDEEYPQFVREEIIVNAVTHRDYSIKGTDIQIKMFDDRIVVESPGKLPGLVKTDNIRHTHFSRNPKIAEFLKAYKYVKEYGEGVNRMFQEMENAGLSDPIYHVQSFMLETIIKNDFDKKLAFAPKKLVFTPEKLTFDSEKAVFEEKEISIQKLETYLDEADTTKIIRNNIIRIFKGLDNKQVFGRKEIMDILKCSDSNAGNLITLMKKTKVIDVVKGKGNGKYIFVI